MKINLKILIPILIAVIVAVLVTTMLLIPRGAGEAEIESPTTTETTPTPTTTIEETETIGLSIVGVSVGYYDYFDPFNPEKVWAGKAGLIDVNITFEGYGIVKQIILKIKNYGNWKLNNSIRTFHYQYYTKRNQEIQPRTQYE
ncbi:MAG: hypothetical protein QXS31_05255 [Desulfurococcaceae archaeon]